MSEKNRDDKNRWRNVTIAFRMSPEENEELNNRVKLSGFRTKQDYIIQSVLHQKVVATGNPLMLVQFRQNLQRIERELERIEKASDMDGELLTPIRSMLEILEKRRILTMERTISFMNGEGSIGHNTRRFIADNVDASRTKNNITLIHEDIKQAYHKLFDEALKEYNAKDRYILYPHMSTLEGLLRFSCRTTAVLL